jgi:antitoxin FitA
MASLTIRNIEDSIKTRLRMRAAARNRSMEEEARHILRDALDETVNSAPNLSTRIRARFAPFGDVELPILEREPVRPAPTFEEPRPKSSRRSQTSAVEPRKRS